MVILTVFVLAFLTAHIYFDWSLKPASKPLFALVSFIAVIGLVGVLCCKLVCEVLILVESF